MEIGDEAFTVCSTSHDWTKQDQIGRTCNTHGETNKYIQLYGLIRDGKITKYILRKTASRDVKWTDDSGNSPIANLCGCTSHSWDFQQRISLADVSLPRVQERFCTTELPRPSVRRWELKDKTNQHRKHRTGYYVYQCPQNILFWFWFIREEKAMTRWNF